MKAGCNTTVKVSLSYLKSWPWCYIMFCTNGKIKKTSGMFVNSFTSHFLEDYTSLACSLVIDSKTSMNWLFTFIHLLLLAKHLELFFREGRSAKSFEVGIFLSSKKTGADPGMSNVADGMLIIPWNTK